MISNYWRSSDIEYREKQDLNLYGGYYYKNF